MFGYITNTKIFYISIVQIKTEGDKEIYIRPQSKKKTGSYFICRPDTGKTTEDLIFQDRSIPPNVDIKVVKLSGPVLLVDPDPHTLVGPGVSFWKRDVF